MTKDPCHNCPEREPGCHSRCPDGIEHDRLREERRERIRAEREKDSAYTYYHHETVDRRVRR